MKGGKTKHKRILAIVASPKQIKGHMVFYLFHTVQSIVNNTKTENTVKT